MHLRFEVLDNGGLESILGMHCAVGQHDQLWEGYNIQAFGQEGGADGHQIRNLILQGNVVRLNKSCSE